MIISSKYFCYTTAMQSRLIVTVIIRKGDEFLFGRKSKDIGPYPNTWHLLGGGVNAEEKLEDALVREVREEAGIEIINIKRVSFQEDFEPNKKGEPTHYIFLIFTAGYQSGELMPGDDIVELRWFHKSELKNIPLPRPSQQYFHNLRLT